MNNPLDTHEYQHKATSKKRIYDFLETQPTGVLATVDPDGCPHASVIYFSTYHDGTFLFTTKARTKKSDNLKYNNKIMLITFDAETQTTAQISGTADLIKDKSLAQESFVNMMDAAQAYSFSGMPPASQLNSGEYVAYQITPSQITMAVYMHPSRKGRDLFDSVVFFKD